MAQSTRQSARKKTTKTPRTRPAEDPGLDTALEIARLALEKKALDVVVLDVNGLTSYADYFVVMSAESEPQLNAIADHVEGTLKERGERPYSIEGTRAGQWILMDYGNVVAHLFYKDTREFYDIEGLWADAERIAVED